MLEAVARLALIAPRRILAVAVLFVVALSVFGAPVAKSLSAGGQHVCSDSIRGWDTGKLTDQAPCGWHGDFAD
jgi:hypothetical protein